MDLLNEYMLPVVSGICFCIGYIVKKWILDVDNKYIPTIAAITGIILSMWISDWRVTPDVILRGLISGLSSTGCHQIFKQYLENKTEE